MDLGTKRPSPELASAPVGDNKEKISYPSFTIRDDKAKAFLAEYDCDVDDDLTSKAKLRVSGVRKDEYGTSIDIEVRGLDDVEVGGQKEAESDEEEKILGYKRSKVASPNETPDTSAESLAD